MNASTFDRSKDYQAVIYARMSSDLQNERSTQQQIEQIRNKLTYNSLNWQIVKVYQDDAISGRTMRERPGYQQMIRDIESERISVDLIIVDTMERLGRHDQMPLVRNNLRQRFGVEIVTGDNNFEDPTTASGRTNAILQEWRATEENRVKAYQVSRGKADAVQQGFWPGGPAPFGYRFQNDGPRHNGRKHGTSTKLAIDESQAFVLRLLFRKAAESNLGAPGLAKFLNDHPDIDPSLKPFHNSTVDTWLANPLYTGTFVYKKFKSDIVNDVRIRTRNADSEIVFRTEFCPAIIDATEFCDVQALRFARKRSVEGPCATDSAKLIKPLLPPTSVKFGLAGLVRCAHCNACMTPTSQSERSKNGYAYYRCPTHVSGACNNSRYVPLRWLEKVVINELLQSYFDESINFTTEMRGTPAITDGPCAIAAAGESAVVDTLIEQVRLELEKLQQPATSPIPAIRQEMGEHESQIYGWALSLGNSSLAPDVRRILEEHSAKASTRLQDLRARLSELEFIEETSVVACDRDLIVGRLRRLPEILLKSNPTRLNLELSLHVDSIKCNVEGEVVVRVCQLGAFAEARELLAIDECLLNEPAATDVPHKIRLRRRLIQRLYREEENELANIAEFAADPHRFANTNEKWFHEKTFSIPKPVGYAEENSKAIATRRKEGLTEFAIAQEFECSIPTVRKALRLEADTDNELMMLPKKMPRARWHEANADEVYRLRQSGESLESLAKLFGKCEETIRKAVVVGRERAGQSTRGE